MGMLIGKPGRWFAAAVVILAVGWLVPVRAVDEDADLRARVLKLNDITGEDTIKGQILALLDDPAGTKKLLATAVKMANNAMNQPLNINATYILATAARGVKEVELSEKFYRLNAEQAKKLESGHRMTMAYLGLTSLLYENKKYDACEKFCKEFLEIKGDENMRRRQADFMERMILAIAKQGRIDEATKLANNLIKSYRGHWLAVEVLGMVQREAGNFEEAAKTYEKVLDAVSKEKGIKEEELKVYTQRYRYILSSIYMDLNQVDKATDQLKALLAEDPDNPTYNNDLGYIWADHDKNLDESEKMIRKAIEEDRKQRRKENPELKPEEDKDNAAYLDSLGWVLFKQKKFKEAKPYLLEAVKDEEGKHIEIYDHLAEVHMALGEKAEAIAAWKKGLELAGPTKREQERKKEVEKKLKAAQ
jgi:tetratricopeptide (TPR) repeat protein